MNQNTSGAVLLLTIAAAGIAWSSPLAVVLVIATCALAFVTEECRVLSTSMLPALGRVEFVLAALSWLTTLAAIIALLT